MNLGDFLEDNYKRVFSYLKKSKKYIYFAIILFFVFCLVGFFVQIPEEFSLKLVDYLKELVEQTAGFGFLEMFNFIFLNNIFVGFFGIVLGSLFGIFPFLNLVANGFVLGYVSNMSVSAAGFGSLWRILPHGIFELPAIFISFGLGLKLGSFVFYKNALEKFREFFKESLRVFVYLILPLLFIAGIIESFLIVAGV